jgi:SulP family sulfate permease
MPTINGAALTVSLASIVIIIALRRLRPHWPGFLIAIATASFAGLALGHAGLPVETIGSKFGGIPSTLPAPSLPEVSLSRLAALLPSALALALLGGIESLLSAVVADGMSGRRHRSNCELVAQGIANIGSALFGGITATGTIARTATNIRAGATSPVAGIVHALALLLMMLVAAPLASYIPLSALAAVLAIVSWNMAEKREFVVILRQSREDGVILLVTFGLTIFVGVAEGIAAGVVLGALIFMHRMAQLVEVDVHLPLLDDEMPDRPSLGNAFPGDDAVAVFRVNGPFFFGAASEVTAVLERIGATPKELVLDLSDVPFCDDSAAHAPSGFVSSLMRRGVGVTIAGARERVQPILARNGIEPPRIAVIADLGEAVAAARRRVTA